MNKHMDYATDIELAIAALRHGAQVLPHEQRFRKNMLADGERIAVTTEAALKARGEVNEAFSLAAAEFRRVAASITTP